jgi:SAM-dependent methyltransferase
MKDWTTYSQLKYPFDVESFCMPFESRIADRVSQGFHILEIGSGPGRFIGLALKNKPANVTIVDPRQDTLSRLIGWSDEARSAFDGGFLRFVNGEWPQVFERVRNEQYDIVFSQSSLHYLDRLARHEALLKIKCVLKNNGVFAMAVRSIDNAWIDNGVARQIESDRWLCQDGIIRTFFTVQGLVRELTEAGFKKENMEIGAHLLEGYEGKGMLSIWLETVIHL